MMMRIGRTASLGVLSKSVLVASIVSGLFGCTLGPDYARPAVNLPAAYRPVAPQLGLAQAAPGQATLQSDWWVLFQDEQLNALMRLALKDNADVQIAIARLAQAEALAKQAGASLYPTLNLSAGAVRASSGTAATVSGVAVLATTTQAALSTSYEIDVWGRVRRNIESATAWVNASRYEQTSVSLTLSALVVNTYLRLRSLDAQISVLNDSVKTRGDSLRIAQVKLDGGLASPIDVNQATAAQAASQASLSEQIRIRAVVQNQLSVLTGKLDLTLAPGDLRALPLPPLPPEGLPATLLEKRPDVNRAEQELRAANARIGVATANLLPTFSLTGLFGAQSVDFSAFLTGQSLVWSAGLGLVQPIFAGGLLQGRLDMARAQQQESLGTYVKVVRGAYGEVSDALVSVSQTYQTEGYLNTQVAAATQAQQLALKRYEAGYVDFLNVLEAQRAANDARLAFVVNRAARLQATVDLFKALGGGWTVEQ
jgi:multidrug efflux system outer membrane protein